MNVNIKQLEALYWADRLGTFQAAANRLHSTQSAISKRIAELEETLGQQLFDRSRRNAKLTPAGERVAKAAEQMLTISRQLLEKGEDSDEYQAVFRLAATEATALTWLPSFLQRVKAEEPTLRLEVEIHQGGVLLEQLNRGEYDLALLPGPMWGKLFKALPLKTLERAWMASPELNTPHKAMNVEELSQFPIGTQYSDTIHARLQSAWFSRAGFPLRNYVQSHSVSVLGELALAGLIVAQLPVGMYSEQLRRNELVRIQVTPELPDVRYYAVYRQSTAHRLAGKLSEIAHECCDFSMKSNRVDIG
ncbi:LysR family transcriptional regulator [Rhodocyclaceae bacterium SMB388]